MSAHLGSFLDIAHRGDVRSLEEALAGGIDVNMTGNVRTTMLKAKILYPSYIKRWLLFFYQEDSTALTLAAEVGHCECVTLLLAHGADVDAVLEVSAMSVVTI